MKLLGVLVCALIFSSLVSWCDEQHHHELSDSEIGSVHFSTSCSKDIQKDFNRAVALLHSFQYEDTKRAFEEISHKDPTCAMAEWGVAMSHYHGLWNNGDTAAGRVAMSKAREVAAANLKTTAREKAYIAALGVVYEEDGRDTYAHGVAFEQKMGALQRAYPDDIEAAIFHALSL